jgi:hypothetical protein
MQNQELGKFYHRRTYTLKRESKLLRRDFDLQALLPGIYINLQGKVQGGIGYFMTSTI